MESIEIAIHVVYDGRTSNVERQKAQAICDAFIDRPQAGREGLVLYGVASRDNKGDNFRLFGLYAVERCIKKFWGDLDEGEKNHIKIECLNLLENGTKSGALEAKFIKAKVVSVIVELAKREWPQKWPELTQRLEQIALRGFTQAELVLDVLKILSEDCTNSDFNNTLPPRRRAEILGEIRQALPTLLQLCFKFLETCYVQITKQPSGMSQVDWERSVKEATYLAKNTLLALGTLAEITPVQSVVEHNLLVAIIEFSKPIPVIGSELQESAWSCLCSFSMKTVPEKTTIDIFQWVSSILHAFGVDVQSMPSLIPLVAPSSTTESVYPVFSLGNDDDDTAERLTSLVKTHELMAKTASNLASNHIEVLIKDANRNNLTSLNIVQTLLDKLTRFLCHPFFQIRNHTFSGVTAVSKLIPEYDEQKSERGMGDKLLIEYLELLFRCLGDNMICVGHPDSPSSPLWPSAALSTELYDDGNEFLLAFKTCSLATTNLIRIGAGRRYLDALRFLRKRIEIACRFDQADVSGQIRVENGGHAYALGRNVQFFLGSSNQNEDNGGEPNSPWTAYMNATMITLVDAIMPKIPNSVFQAFGQLSTIGDGMTNDIVAGAQDLRRILDLVVNCQPMEPCEWFGCAHVLSRLTKCYGALPDGPNIWLGAVLNKLFIGATYTNPRDEQRGTLGQQTLLARKRACNSLVEACTQLSHGPASSPEIRSRLGQLLPDFCNQVLSVVNNPNIKVQASEKILLYEVLVIVSNTVPDQVTQRRFLDDILQAPMEVWTSPQTTELLQDIGMFVQSLRQVPADTRIRDIKRNLMLLLAIGRHAEPVQGDLRPFSMYWPRVLPNILKLLGVIHGIWNPQASNNANLDDIKSIYQEEYRCLIGQKSNAKGGKISLDLQSSTPLGGFGDDVGFGGGVAGPGKKGPKWTEEEMSESAKKVLRNNLLLNLRELAYSSLGSCFRYGQTGIIGLPDLLHGFLSLVVKDIEFIEHRHLARFLSATLVPFVQNYPRESWHQSLFPFLASMLGHVHNRLTISWCLLIPSKSSADDLRVAQERNRQWQPIIVTPMDIDNTDENVALTPSCQTRTCGKCTVCQQTEVARDASINALGTSMVELIGTILAIYKGGQPSPLCEAVLNNDQMAAATLLSLTSCIASSDNAACLKASNVIRKLLGDYLLKVTRLHNFVLNQLFCACFGTLFRPKNDPALPLEGKKATFQPQSPYRRMLNNTLMQGVPNLMEQDILTTENNLMQSSTEKGRRTRVKEFIQTCLYERQNSDAATDLQTQLPFLPVKNQREVEDLPPQMRNQKPNPLVNRQGSWSDAQNAWDLGVQALFDNGNSI